MRDSSSNSACSSTCGSSPAWLRRAKVATWLQQTSGIEREHDMDSIKAMVTANRAGAKALTPKVLSSVRAGGTFILAILINIALIPVVMFCLIRDRNVIMG